MPEYPLARLPGRARWFQALLALSLAMLALMGWIGSPLTTPAAPQGIVSFEFAWSEQQTQAMLDSWPAETQLRAAFIQGLDFLYLLVYGAAFGLGCLLSAEVLQARRWPLAGAGLALAWGMALAAGFDFVENIGLTLALFGWVASPWPQIAAICAGLKFALLFAALVYLFYGLAARFAAQPGPRSKRI